MTKTAVYPLC